MAVGASVAAIARTARVSERAVGLYLAGSRAPRPEVLVRLAAAVQVAPGDLCTVDRQVLAHLRVFTGRSRAAMAVELGMAEATYRELETTGQRGRLASSRYSDREDRWIAWQEWAPPKFGATADQLAAAEQNAREHCEAERERRWQQLRHSDPAFAAKIEEVGREVRALRAQQ